MAVGLPVDFVIPEGSDDEGLLFLYGRGFVISSVGSIRRVRFTFALRSFSGFGI